MTHEELCRLINERNPEDWRNVFRHLPTMADDTRTVMHLPFSTSWIFTTGRHCRWCMDPAPRGITDTAVLQTIAAELSRFDFCILSHLHSDHYDRRLMAMLCTSPRLRWVIPACIAETVLKQCPLNPKLVTILAAGETFEYQTIRITAYPGMHNEPGNVEVPEASFLVELPDGKRLAFPVDVRNYALRPPADMTHVDWLFAHVWLGRNVSHLDAFPLLDDFCQFCLSFSASHTLLAHLFETGRDEKSMWTDRHARLVQHRLAELAPDMPVSIPVNGSSWML